jgi:capsular polysaccharide export protein
LKSVGTPVGPACAWGFSWRKRSFLRTFTGRDDLRFVRSGRAVAPGADLYLWGNASPPAGLPRNVRIVRVEDGFVRSVGLGADLTRPLSWVLDGTGIYYNARQPSALERILQDGDFHADELARARALRTRIVQAGLTKYNLGATAWEPQAGGRSVVLVPGQVETDASIAGGCHDLRTNIGLLRAVRATRPHAWIVYKPHPDVVAGLRRPGAGEDEASHACDEILLQGSMHDILACADEIHVLTSLAGFEALLRDKPVVCWGQPFYAGWGLTQDSAPHPRRTRRLSVDELVAGALLRYPVYALENGERCSPEQAVDELLRWRGRISGATPWWRRLVRPWIARD